MANGRMASKGDTASDSATPRVPNTREPGPTDSKTDTESNFTPMEVGGTRVVFNIAQLMFVKISG